MPRHKNLKQIDRLEAHIKIQEEKIKNGDNPEKAKATIEAIERAIRMNRLEYEIWALKKDLAMYRKVVKYPPLTMNSTELNKIRNIIKTLEDELNARLEELKDMDWRWL